MSTLGVRLGMLQAARWWSDPVVDLSYCFTADDASSLKVVADALVTRAKGSTGGGCALFLGVGTMSRVAPVTALHLADNRMGPNSCAQLTTLLKTSPPLNTLSVLDLEHNRYGQRLPNSLLCNAIGDKGAESIAIVLKDPTIVLRELYLGYNSIGDAGAQQLAEALKMNKTLKVLSLQANKITDTGAAFLLQAVKTNSTLTHLDLGNNKLTTRTAEIVAATLSVNQSLTSINMGLNNLAGGAVAIGTAISGNSNISNLSLAHTSIGNEGVSALAKALTSNTHLRCISLASNNLTDDSATSLAELLKHNHTITDLKLEFNLIGDGGAIKLRKAVSDNPAIRKLNLSNNPMIGDKSIVQGILEELETNQIREREKLRNSAAGTGTVTDQTPTDPAKKTHHHHKKRHSGDRSHRSPSPSTASSHSSTPSPSSTPAVTTTTAAPSDTALWELLSKQSVVGEMVTNVPTFSGPNRTASMVLSVVAPPPTPHSKSSQEPADSHTSKTHQHSHRSPSPATSLSSSPRSSTDSAPETKPVSLWSNMSVQSSPPQTTNSNSAVSSDKPITEGSDNLWASMTAAPVNPTPLKTAVEPETPSDDLWSSLSFGATTGKPENVEPPSPVVDSSLWGSMTTTSPAPEQSSTEKDVYEEDNLFALLAKSKSLTLSKKAGLKAGLASAPADSPRTSINDIAWTPTATTTTTAPVPPALPEAPKHPAPTLDSKSKKPHNGSSSNHRH
ncbi:NOD3 protein [Pelomyxa schiedti]|nr:NOD3 protein [Pelomyxa schiedti]